MTETLMVETSALVAIILEEPGWRQLAEQIVNATAFTTCVNVFEESRAIGREPQVQPLPAAASDGTGSFRSVAPSCA